MAVLGIDTSCYTTAVALVAGRQLVAEYRRVLDVSRGERGLSQSQALFQHLNNLPDLLELALHQAERLDAVAVSSQPRSMPQSYMPVFLAGHGQARGLAAALGVPLFAVSHQEGHLEAGCWSSELALPEQFVAVHLSGGTSELLLVERNQGNYRLDLLGGSSDLNAGQLVDRVGVAMGLPFPAGPALEQLAREARGEVSIPSSVKGYNFSFSGPETHALRLLATGAAPEEVARAVEQCIAVSLEKVLRRARDEFGLQAALVVGGVAANTYLRQRLRQRLEHRAVGMRLGFARPEFSSDNAVGVALLGEARWKDWIERR